MTLLPQPLETLLPIDLSKPPVEAERPSKPISPNPSFLADFLPEEEEYFDFQI
jgi:hypothetical protein